MTKSIAMVRSHTMTLLGYATGIIKGAAMLSTNEKTKSILNQSVDYLDERIKILSDEFDILE